MRNQTSAAGPARPPLPPPPFALAAVAWSEAQLQRLRGEWLGALRAFAYHPFAAVTVLRGDPPSHYRVDYRVRSLVMDAAEQLQYADSVSVEIWIPPGYPSQPVLVRPLTPIFHPNIFAGGVQFAANSQSPNSLLDVIHRVGEYLAWRSYDPGAVVNDVALQWLTDNPQLLPLDPRADFTADAGGEPLGRITRFGPATLEQMRKSMAELIAALSGEAAGPTIEQVRAFGHHTRIAMRLFLEPDIPAELRLRAHEFDQCALDLPASVPSWEYIRRLKAWAQAVLDESGQLTEGLGQLTEELANVAKLVSAPFQTAEEASQHIPPSAVLDPSLLRLPALFTESATHFESLRAKLGALDLRRPANPLQEQAVLAKHLKQKLTEAEDDVEFARHSASEALTKSEPALKAARAEVSALRVIGRWREYIDLFSKAASLEQQVAQIDSDAVDGFFIQSSDGTIGPFLFEQEVDLGTTSVVVSAGTGGTFEVHHAESGATLARGMAGKGTAMVPIADGPPKAFKFKLVEGVEQPLLQLEYALKQTATLLPKLQSATAGEAQSWCGRMITAFADVEAQQAARSMHRRAQHRWEALIAELIGLLRFKARLSTHFLVTRATRRAPRLIAERSALQAQVTQATAAIAAIVARSSRDEQSGQLIVPSKYAKSYTEQSAAIEVAGKRIRRIESRLKSLSNALRDRLASPRMCGRPEVPELKKLRPLSPGLTDLAPLLSDENLRASAAQLAALLKVSLIVNFTPPPQRPVRSASTEMALDTLGAAVAPVSKGRAENSDGHELDAGTIIGDETLVAAPASELAEQLAAANELATSTIDAQADENRDIEIVADDDIANIDDNDDRVEL